MMAQALNVRSDAQGAHLAIANEQQAHAVDDLQHLINRRNVQRIVRPVARYHLRRHGQSQRVQRCYHHLDLTQSRIVLAVPKLEQAIVTASVMTRNRRRVQAYPLLFQVVHPHDVAAQVRLDRLPRSDPAQAP
jgi:hypothetical protein